MSDGKMGRAGSYGEPWTTYEGRVGSDRHYYFIQGADAESEFGKIIAGEDHRGDDPLPIKELRTRMRRATACVNACAGMDDPAKEIERLHTVYQAAFRAISLLNKATARQLYGSVFTALDCLEEAFFDD